jgi:hypothetical protein
MKTGRWRQRQKPGSWYPEERRGQWYAVNRGTGRRLKTKDREQAAEVCVQNNTREIFGTAKCCRPMAPV